MASRDWSWLPASASRKPSEDTTLSAPKRRRAKVDLPDAAAPTSITSAAGGMRIVGRSAVPGRIGSVYGGRGQDRVKPEPSLERVELVARPAHVAVLRGVAQPQRPEQHCLGPGD